MHKRPLFSTVTENALEMSSRYWDNNYLSRLPIGHMVLFYTIGNSTRSIDEFLSALRTHGVDLVIDVRRFPGSERHPHFNRDALDTTLGEHQIEYRHLNLLVVDAQVILPILRMQPGTTNPSGRTLITPSPRSSKALSKNSSNLERATRKRSCVLRQSIGGVTGVSSLIGSSPGAIMS